MPATEAGISTVVILLAAATGLLFFLLLTAVGIRGRLVRLERLLASRKDDFSSAGVEFSQGRTPAAEVEANSGGVFENFLSEDPSRRNLSKKEQAAAYRKWRQEKGMNWSNS